MSVAARAEGVALRLRWWSIGLLALTVVVFAAIRVSIDLPNIVNNDVPEPGNYHRRFAQHPYLAYLHILPGLVYMVGAPLQLWRGFRSRHWTFHRRLGRVILSAGLVTGLFALVFGLLFPFGGPGEAAATATFGAFFLTALTLAFAAIRRKDVAAHRRWMIRAFAVGLGVGTQRLWLGLLALGGWLPFEESFALAFWLAWVPHAIAAEIYLTLRPDPWPEQARQVALEPTAGKRSEA